MEMAQIEIEKIRFHVVCAVHNVMKTYLSHINNTATFTCSLNVALDAPI